MAAVLAVGPVAAQNGGQASQDQAKDSNPWGFSVGLGGGAGPVYPGAGKVAPSVTPFAELTWRDRVTLGGQAGQGIAVKLWETGPLTLGAGLSYESGRPSDAADALAGTDAIAGGAGVSLQAGLSWFGGLGVNAALKRVLAGPASGTTLDLSGKLGAPVPGTGQAVILGVRPSLELANKGYMHPRFGIDSGEATAGNGYAPYEAGAGVVSYGLPAGLIASQGAWQVLALAGPSWPGHEAEASPINRRRVNWQGFAAVAYRLLGGD